MQIIEDQKSLMVRNHFSILLKKKKDRWRMKFKESNIYEYYIEYVLWPEPQRNTKASSIYDKQSCENALRPNTTKLAANVSG